MITTEIINSSEKFYVMREEWNALLEKSGAKNPYLTHEWFSSWWKGYGKDKKLCILCFKDAQGKTIGIVPLMEYKTRLLKLSVNCIGFLANHWAQYDILYGDKDNLPHITEKLLNYLYRRKKLIILSYFNHHSQALAILLEHLQSRRIKYTTTIKNAPFLKIQGKWEDYLRQRSYRFRSEYKKKKKLIESKGNLELCRVNLDFAIPIAIDLLAAISTNSWQGKNKVAVLSKSEGRIFYNNLFTAWKAKRLIDISVLKLNEKPLSYIVGFSANGHFYVFDTAFDARYEEMSPGLVNHNMLLEQIFNNGTKVFDFGYAADYKTRWTDTSNHIVDVTIFPGNVEGLALRTAQWVKRLNKDKKDK